MKTTFKVEENNYVMYFEGRLDTAVSAVVQKEVNVLNDCEGHDVILDCSDLTYISSSGMRIFLNILKNAKAKSSQVYIRNVSDDIYSVLSITGFTNIFDFI